MSSNNGMMDATTATAKRTYRQTRTIQPEIDSSLPLHPWASASKHQQQQQQQQQQRASAIASTSYRTARNASPSHPQPPPVQPQPQPQPTYAMSMHPPQSFPLSAAPVPAASFYGQPQPALHANAAYIRATPMPIPIPEAQYVAPVPALPKKNLPTRADLDFLLGGSFKARARSSTPNGAAQQTRPLSTVSAQAFPHQTLPKQRYSLQPDMQAYAAGPSRLSVSAARAPSRQVSERHDDDLPLGAEAVMESDHEAGSSFEADNEEEKYPQDKDDPNDGDFRLYGRPPAAKRSSRVSQTSEGAAADASAAGGNTSAPAKRGRRSLASNSTTAGKVAGSAGYLTPDGPKRRGRPPKEAYTPDILEQIKAANEMLGIDMEDQEGMCKKRLHEIVDWKTRQALSPEMRAVLLRARNTQLQRERLKRLRETGTAGPVLNKRKAESKEGSVTKSDKAEADAAKPRRTKKQREDETETGSGSAILERAKGKVSEWIKTISSEAEMSNEDWAEQRASSSSSKQPGATPPPPVAPAAPAAPAASEAKDANIDPRLFGAADDERLVQGFFSRFGTVTGSQAAEKGYAEGGEGDEYYFSN